MGHNDDRGRRDREERGTGTISGKERKDRQNGKGFLRVEFWEKGPEARRKGKESCNN